MNNKFTMENLKLVYDRDNNKFVKAFVTINGEKKIITDDSKIRAINKAYAGERGVGNIKKIPDEYSLAYATNKKVIASFEKKYKNAKEIDNEPTVTPVPVVLKKNNNPYDNSTAEFDEDLRKEKFWKKVSIGTGIGIGVVALGLAGWHHINSNAKNGKALEAVQDKELEKVDPESWEQYVSNYDESIQKTFLTGSMEQIENNIVSIKVNNKEYKVALSPEELIALNYYYNTYEMTNEDMLSTYGLYNFQGGKDSNLTSNVHNALEKIMISLSKADSKEDVLQFQFDDEEVQKLWNKYVDYVIEYNNSKSYKNVRKQIEEEFRKDYLDNGSIDINEHPAATFILQTVPFIFEMNNDYMNSNLRKSLLGVEDNNNGKVTIAQNGIVDESCSYIDERLEEFDDYRQTKLNDYKIDSRLNESLLLEVNEDLKDEKGPEYYEARYIQSDYSKLTENTYDLKNVMIPLMNDYLERNYELDELENFEEINSEIMKDTVIEMQQQQTNNNEPWDLEKNPSGGKPGESIKEEPVKNVPVTEQQLISSGVSQETLEEARQEYLEKHPDILENEEAFQKQYQEDTANASAAWDVGYAETKNAGPDAALTLEYANHKDEVIRNAYFMGRTDGINFYNQMKAVEEKNKQPQVDPELGEMAGEHKNNPNQNGSNKVVDSPVIEEIVTQRPDEKTPSKSEPDKVSQKEMETVQPENDIPEHSSNPNQNGNNNVVEDIPIIEEIDTKDLEENNESEQEKEVETESEVEKELENEVETEKENVVNDHNENKNQNENNNEIEDTPVSETIDTTNKSENVDDYNVIIGTETTDSTGVEDMSKYGEVMDASVMSFRNDSTSTSSNETEDVQESSVTETSSSETTTETVEVEETSYTVEEVSTTSISSESYEQIIDSYINELADPNSEINMEIESSYELVK